MTEEIHILTLPQGDIATCCARLREALEQTPPGGALYVSGPTDLPAVLDKVRLPGAGPWHVLAGPLGLEAWTMKDAK